MNEITNITVEQLREVSSSKPFKCVMWKGLKLSIRTLIPFEEVSHFVNNVVESCIDKDRNIIIPEMEDFAFRANIVLRYAYVDLPKDIDEQYIILYNTDLYDVVIGAVNSGQVEAIKKAIKTCMDKAMK